MGIGIGIVDVGDDGQLDPDDDATRRNSLVAD